MKKTVSKSSKHKHNSHVGGNCPHNWIFMHVECLFRIGLLAKYTHSQTASNRRGDLSRFLNGNLRVSRRMGVSRDKFPKI